MRYFRKTIIALFATALAAILCGCQDVQWDYEAEEVPCTLMQFESASVREEPAAIGGHHFPSNEIGAITEDGFTMLISSGRVFRVEDVDNSANGDFYGIEVEDIISTPEGKAWFPPEEVLKEDSDGIVWVNWEYSNTNFRLNLPPYGRLRAPFRYLLKSFLRTFYYSKLPENHNLSLVIIDYPAKISYCY